MDVKVIAFHLPQFHTFKENDEWWGEGFTEWTNVKRANRLCRGHNQPRVPLNNNYYDLSKLESMLWQMKLAKKYGLYGFCYYHYWFNGKKLLHLPLEAIRDYKGEKINYCLCWANEPWARTWDGHDTDVLMPQVYGGQENWHEHYRYLRSFFLDPFYIRKNNRPVFILYRSSNIPNCDEMIAYWDELCRKDGFDGIYIIEEYNAFQEKAYCNNSQAVLCFEPLNSINNARTTYERIRDKLVSLCFNLLYRNKNTVNFYSAVWRRIILNDKKLIHDTKEKRLYLGAFVGWDNTPRKGKRGRIIFGANPERFEMYFRQQINMTQRTGEDMLFINAWNEWGEGAYLEPDSVYGYRYLEAISRTVQGKL